MQRDDAPEQGQPGRLVLSTKGACSVDPRHLPGATRDLFALARDRLDRGYLHGVWSKDPGLLIRAACERCQLSSA